MDQALALDPAFALAHAERARILMQLYFNHRQTEADAKSAREQALLAVTEALRLAPDLGEAHRALALYYYWGLLDYASAERELTRARELLPNDSVSAQILGLVRRRQNRFDEAIDLFRDAYRLNPSNQKVREMYALALFDMGRYAEADAAMADLLARFPEVHDLLFGRALLSFCRTGETDSLRALPDTGFSSAGKEWVDYVRWLVARYEGRLEDALAIVSAGTGDDFGFEFRPLALAESQFLLGDFVASAANAQPIADRIEAERQANPDVLGVDFGLADAYLFAGRPEDARRAAREMLDTDTLERAAMEYWDTRRILSRTYAMLGDKKESLDLLELVQHGPRHDCGNELRHDPAFAAFRDDPRFQQIAADSDWK
jgi:tetratricopeptide (TPR) repeat protein